MERYTQNLEQCLLLGEEKSGEWHKGEAQKELGTDNVLFLEQCGRSMKVHIIIITNNLHFL